MRVGAIAQYNYFRASNNYNKSQSFQGGIRNLTPEQIEEINDLKVFTHHIYEYKKGLRNLILTTEKAKHRETIERKLQSQEIPYIIHDLKKGEAINVFFGAESCVNVVKTFNPRLNKLTAEQDFILGIMLGYDRVKQCDRYMKIKRNEIKLSPTGED